MKGLKRTTVRQPLKTLDRFEMDDGLPVFENFERFEKEDCSSAFENCEADS